MDVQSHPAPRQRFTAAVGIAILCALALAVFGDVLAVGNKRLLSEFNKDITSYFYWVRYWGFSQLAHGHLPLWNPHIMAGCPFFGNVQSALLYPPNWIFVFVPTAAAVNWSIFLHVLAAGVFTLIWAHRRGLSAAGATLAGAIFMLCGACICKVPPGHLALICAIAWLPVVLIAIDGLFATGRLSWSLLGSFAVAMQLLAGSAQYAYYTGLVAALYTILNLARDRKHLGKVVAGVAVIFILGGGIAAWQVLMGMQSESMRAEGLDYEAASVGMIPPSRLVALLSPIPFRERSGAGSPDILTFNISVAGLVLAAVGAIWGEKRLRRFSTTMAIILAVLALGRFTPLYTLLYNYLPKFGFFRVVGRIAAFSSLFLAMLAGIGFDRLKAIGGRIKPAIWVTTAAAILVATLAVAIAVTAHRSGGGLGGAMVRLGVPPDKLKSEEIAGGDVPWLWRMLLTGSGLLVMTAALLSFARKFGTAHCLIAAIALAELLVTARMCVPRVPMARDGTSGLMYPVEPQVGKMKASHLYPAAWRTEILDAVNQQRTYTIGNKPGMYAMLFGAYDTGGYEAMVFDRYQVLRDAMRETQQGRPNDVEPLFRHAGVLAMLRVRAVLRNRPADAMHFSRPLGQVTLVDDCRVVNGTQASLDAVMKQDFDPARIVILESQPAVPPQRDSFSPGRAEIVRQDTDEMEIEADLSRPAILLVTDAYSSHWRARPIGQSAQQEYQVMPADLLLRAIPLGAGKHHFILGYRPKHYELGKWITIGSMALWLIAVICLAVSWFRTRNLSSSDPIAG